jgi:hypothetical protein
MSITYVTPQEIDDYRLAREIEYLVQKQPKFFIEDGDGSYDLAMRIRIRRIARAQEGLSVVFSRA